MDCYFFLFLICPHKKWERDMSASLNVVPADWATSWEQNVDCYIAINKTLITFTIQYGIAKIRTTVCDIYFYKVWLENCNRSCKVCLLVLWKIIFGISLKKY